MKNLPKKYLSVWRECLPLLKKGRPGDVGHAEETVRFILDYEGKIKFDPDVIIPVAMMHDIGHFMILPEHFKYVTGPEKLINGKLAHMLIGAKVASDILGKIDYNKRKTKEIINIISTHDFDQIKDVDYKKIYNTINKKFFHDIDSLDRYTEKRIKSVSSIFGDRKDLLKILEKFLELFFYKEFRNRAEDRLNKLYSDINKK